MNYILHRYQHATALHNTLDDAGVDNFLISCPGWEHVLDFGYFGPQQLERYALQRLLAFESLKPEKAVGTEEAWGWGIYVAIGMSIFFGLMATIFMYYLDKWQTQALASQQTDLVNNPVPSAVDVDDNNKL